MYISDLHDHNTEMYDKKVQDFIPNLNKEAIKREIAELVDLEFDRLEERAGYFITQTAAKRAEQFLLRVLKGEEEASKALFGIEGGENSRYRPYGYDKGKPWASLIHGHLFETSGIKLRRQIVEANVDLLQNERILDLESIVDGLQQQIKELKDRL